MAMAPVHPTGRVAAILHLRVLLLGHLTGRVVAMPHLRALLLGHRTGNPHRHRTDNLLRHPTGNPLLIVPVQEEVVGAPWAVAAVVQWEEAAAEDADT